MMKHTVVGYGNLGESLERKIKTMGGGVQVLSRSTGYEASDIPKAISKDSSCIWISLGHGSIKEAEENFEESLKCHAELVENIIRATTARVVAFSTDYVPYKLDCMPDDDYDCSILSKYAITKRLMEKSVQILDRPNTHVVRVGSLYGSFKPERCFPEKLKANAKNLSDHVHLPKNKVSPTPTDWVAEILLDNYYCFRQDLMFSHVGPSDNVKISDWGKVVLGPKYVVMEGSYDTNRPESTLLDCSFLPIGQVPTWRELWDKYGEEKC